MYSKIRRLSREKGFMGALRVLGRKLYDRHKSVWFELNLEEAPEVIAPRFDGKMDFDHPDQTIEYIKNRNESGTNDPAEMGSMKERGHLFVSVMDGDNIIGFVKIGWDTIYVLDYGSDIRVRSGDFFVIDIFIGPEARGLGAGPFLVSAASAEMKKRGFKRGVMHVRDDKIPMLRTCARTGYREIGRVDYMSIAGKKIFRPNPSTFLGIS
jgi:ribosomal protein S18 acetylase RimI-like enzyme